MEAVTLHKYPSYIREPSPNATHFNRGETFFFFFKMFYILFSIANKIIHLGRYFTILFLYSTKKRGKENNQKSLTVNKTKGS